MGIVHAGPYEPMVGDPDDHRPTPSGGSWSIPTAAGAFTVEGPTT